MGYIAIVGYQEWRLHRAEEGFKYCLSQVETTGICITAETAVSEARKFLQQWEPSKVERRLVSLQIMEV